MNITEQYKDKQLMEMECEVLPPDYQKYLDSQQPKITTEEEKTWAQLQSF